MEVICKVNTRKGEVSMRKFKTVFMRGGTSKGCMFLKEDLPEDRAEWDSIFLQAMGDPDPKQIDGLGGTVSSNNKIVVVWKSEESGIDVEYLVEVKEPITTVHMLNRNTDKTIDVTVPCENGTFALEGDCMIAGVDGTAPELKVNFLNPAGAKTGKLLPTGNALDILDIPGVGIIEASILDISNPMVIVKAEDVGLKGTKLPEEVNSNKVACNLLEKIRSGEEHFDFVEVMACPYGCIGGAGQPFGYRSVKQERSTGMYKADKSAIIKRSGENPVVSQLYENGVLKGRSHELLHVNYLKAEE